MHPQSLWWEIVMALLLVEELGMCSELEPSPIASKEKTQPQEEAWEWERVLFESELCDVPKVSKKTPSSGPIFTHQRPTVGTVGAKNSWETYCRPQRLPIDQQRQAILRD
jgi:hypothetical protein